MEAYHRNDPLGQYEQMRQAARRLSRAEREDLLGFVERQLREMTAPEGVAVIPPRGGPPEPEPCDLLP